MAGTFVSQHFHHSVEILRNGEWMRIGEVTYPFADCLTLDDSLDYGSITLTGIRERKMNFMPFELIRINTFYEDALTPHELRERKYWRVSAAKRVQRTFDKVPYVYDYVLELIEPTKELERCIVDTMTVTIPKGHEYPEGAIVIESSAIKKGDLGRFEYKNNIVSPVLGNKQLVIPSFGATIITSPGHVGYITTNLEPETCKITVTINGENYETTGLNSSLVIPAEKVTGVNISLIKYWASCLSVDSSGHVDPYHTSVSMEFDNMSIINQIEQKTAPTITYVIKRLLSAGVTRTKSTPQKYTLHPAIAEKYDSVLSPEFFFTRSTLREALTQVGNWDIHAIPRYDYFQAGTTPNGTEYPEGWYVTYDELGGNEESPLPNSKFELMIRKNIQVPLVGKEEYITCDNYCGGLDSYAENILNTRDLTQGSITEPCFYGWITPRTEDGFLIQNDTALIATTKGANRVTELFIQYDGKTYNLTPWVFEQAEYDTMTGFSGSYPYAKEYALVYKQGEKNIRGLQFKASTLTGAFNQPTIENIMKSAFGVTVTEPYKNLKFRVTYIPYLTERVTQKKAYTGWDSDNVKINNQGANGVESEWYGAHLKGKLAMLGNATEILTYSFARYEDVPHVGELVHGKYVAQIARQFDAMTIRATITVTENFNKLNEYNAINSAYRVYDVSELQAADRFVHYDEILTIGDKETGKKTHLTDDSAGLMFDTLDRYYIGSIGDPTCMLAQGVFDNGAKMQPVSLPVSSLAFGNSILFSSAYETNYAAGKNSNQIPEGAGPNPSEVAEQKLVKYTDVNGELQYLNIRFCLFMQNDAGSSTRLANRLPALLQNDFDSPYFAEPVVDFSAENDWWNVEKDNREALRIGYQLHGQANRMSIVVGTRMFSDNPLATRIDWTKRPVLVFLPERLNMLRPRVDVTKATNVGGSIVFTRDGRENLYFTVAADAEKIKQYGIKSWVLYDTQEGVDKARPYYIGENIQFDADGNPMLPPVYFNF